MKKKNVFFSLVIGIALLLSSCSITSPYAVSSAPLGNKKGVSKTFCLGTIQFNGNHSVAEAVDNGNLTGGVATVDIKTNMYLGLFIWSREIIVHGE